MRSRNACKRASRGEPARAAIASAARSWIGGAIAAFALIEGHAARADTKQECSTSYDNTQVLRDANNLEAALKEAQICARDVCAKFIRDDCAKWRTDLEARESSVVIEVIGANALPMADGVVTLDGAKFLDHLDAEAHVLPKGTHALTITVRGAAPHSQSIVVQEGEKNRKLSYRLFEGDDGAVLADADAPPPKTRKHALLVPGIVLGASSLAVAIGGAVLLGLATDKASRITSLCGTSPPNCTGSDADLREANDLSQSGKQFEIAGGSLVALGGAGIAVGVTMMLLRGGGDSRATSTAALVPGVWFTNDEGGVWLRGAF